MPKGGPKKDPYPGYDKLKRVVTVKTRKFMVNKLLCRKQMVLTHHTNTQNKSMHAILAPLNRTIV